MDPPLRRLERSEEERNSIKRRSNKQLERAILNLERSLENPKISQIQTDNLEEIDSDIMSIQDQLTLLVSELKYKDDEIESLHHALVCQERF